nr:hypothetical protein [Microbacterium sp. NIBRBAC000506063]
MRHPAGCGDEVEACRIRGRHRCGHAPGDRLGGADDERAREYLGIESIPAERRPPALRGLGVHHLRPHGPEPFDGLLIAVGYETVNMEPDGLRFLFEGFEHLAIQVHYGNEPFDGPANDAEHEGQAEPCSTDRGLGAAADAHPDGDRPCRHGWLEDLVHQRRAEAARPGDGLVAQQSHQQIEFLLEQLLVVVQVETVQRERLDRRSATDDELRSPLGDGVEGGELVVYAHGILRAEHGDRRTEFEGGGASRDRGEGNRGCAVHHAGR